MKTSDATILISLVVSAAAVGGLLYWGSSRAHPAQGTAPGASPPLPTPTPIGPFPSLAVNTPVLVDSAKANLPPPFNAVPLVACVVDMILSDPALVSVRTGVPGVASFSGTIPRSAIVQILPAIPPELLQV